jgi:hypoxanthine phosphoribosyltransferase
MKTLKITYKKYTKHCKSIVKQIKKDKWQPDLVVGLSGSGLLAGQIIAQDLGCDFQSLNWSADDGRNCSDAALASEIDEDGIKVLIIDGASVSGGTISSLKEDLDACVYKDLDFEDQIRIAVLCSTTNGQELSKARYVANTVETNKDQQIIMPWEKTK